MNDDIVKVTNGPKERAEALADYFCSVFTKEEKPSMQPSNTLPNIDEVITTPEEVFQVQG